MRILDRAKIKYETVPYTYDAENLDVGFIARENGLELETVFKTLVLKGDRNGVLVAVVAGNRSLNMKAAARLSGNKKIHLMPIKELEKNTGYIRGGCSPIGMKKKYPVLLDKTAESFPLIYINAGTRGLLLGLPPEELIKVSDALVCGVGE